MANAVDFVRAHDILPYLLSVWIKTAVDLRYHLRTKSYLPSEAT